MIVLRLLSFCVIILTVGFLLLSCASTPEQQAGGDAESTTIDPALPEPAQISFDPAGSDSETISGLQTINFAYDQATLSDQAKEQLSQNADWIRQNSNVTLQIEGHCDKRGSLEYNLSLGQRRAEIVKTYLMELGIPSERLNTISFGEEKLLSEGDSEEDHRQNRRANFLPLQ